ncbi:MAG: TRAP transporter fused permease subunit [Pseudolabrys sp.]
MTESIAKRPPIVLDYLYYVVSISLFLAIFVYYWTGIGGPTLLAMTLIPVVYVLFILQALRENDFYPSLPPVANYLIAFAFSAFSFYCAYYMNTEYMALGLERAGAWNTTDMVMGGVMTLLIMEYARKRHMPLFILNIVLILYAVYGNWVPGMFYHAGLSWERLITANSVEVATGIFSRLPQIALTTVGSFLLVLSLLRGFGCIESLLRATKRVAFRSPHAIPQSAVVGSMCVGMVSGSGAANAITIGSATIPAMIASGIPPATAAAIESASSLGGQLMPPVMGIAAFLMAEFLGVDYFDVVARGWVPALIYYATVSTSVYLLAIEFRTRIVITKFDSLAWRDIVNLVAFIATVGGLVALMAILFLAPMFAALYIFCIVGAVLLTIHVADLLRTQQWTFAKFIKPIRTFLDAYMDMICDLALLLATLSIMTAALVITGVPTKLGSLLLQAAGVNIAAMVLMAFIFGAILGTGLPPAPTYILVAIVIAPPMIQAGINPWVVHFFAFFLACFGELTPPTSLVAAVTAKIANASFYKVLNRAMQICISLFTLMVAVFVHPELVIEPGLDQIGAALLVGVATIGMSFSIQARFADARGVDAAIRATIAAFALVALFVPNYSIATAACLPVLVAIGYWVVYRRRLEAGEPDVVELEAKALEPAAAGTGALGPMS